MKSDNSKTKATVATGGIVAVFVAVACLFKGCGFNFGLFPNGSGSDSNSNSNTNTNTSNSSYSEENIEVTQEAITDSNVNETSEEAITIIEVTVSGSEYIYENSTIGLDDLMNELKEIDEKIIVEINDDNSSKKAYDALKDKLESNNISYSEK